MFYLLVLDNTSVFISEIDVYKWYELYENGDKYCVRLLV